MIPNHKAVLILISVPVFASFYSLVLHEQGHLVHPTSMGNAIRLHKKFVCITTREGLFNYLSSELHKEVTGPPMNER
jgi:hypothetical protein